MRFFTRQVKVLDNQVSRRATDRREFLFGNLFLWNKAQVNVHRLTRLFGRSRGYFTVFF